MSTDCISAGATSKVTQKDLDTTSPMPSMHRPQAQLSPATSPSTTLTTWLVTTWVHHADCQRWVSSKSSRPTVTLSGPMRMAWQVVVSHLASTATPFSSPRQATTMVRRSMAVVRTASIGALLTYRRRSHSACSSIRMVCIQRTTTTGTMVLRRGLFSNCLHSFLRFEPQTRRGHKPRRGLKSKNELN